MALRVRTRVLLAANMALALKRIIRLF